MGSGNWQRVAQGEFRDIIGNDLFADESMAVDDDGPLQIDRGLTAAPEGDDVDDERVSGTGQPKKPGVFRGDIRLVLGRNEERGDDEKGLMGAIQHLKPHERLFARIGQQNVIFDRLKSEEAERELDDIFAAYSALFRLDNFKGFH